MNELYYLHLSWMINVLLSLMLGFVLGYLYKSQKGDKLEAGKYENGK